MSGTRELPRPAPDRGAFLGSERLPPVCPDLASPASVARAGVLKDVTCGYLPRAQYVSRRVSCRHVSAGQSQMVPRTPEP
jgi:hypothetical protein